MRLVDGLRAGCEGFVEGNGAGDRLLAVAEVEGLGSSMAVDGAGGVVGELTGCTGGIALASGGLKSAWLKAVGWLLEIVCVCNVV